MTHSTTTNFVGMTIPQLVELTNSLKEKQDHDTLYQLRQFCFMHFGEDYEALFYLEQQMQSKTDEIPRRFLHIKNDILMAELDNSESEEEWIAKLSDTNFQDTVCSGLKEEYNLFIQQYEGEFFEHLPFSWAGTLS